MNDAMLKDFAHRLGVYEPETQKYKNYYYNK